MEPLRWMGMVGCQSLVGSSRAHIDGYEHLRDMHTGYTNAIRDSE